MNEVGPFESCTCLMMTRQKSECRITYRIDMSFYDGTDQNGTRVSAGFDDSVNTLPFKWQKEIYGFMQVHQSQVLMYRTWAYFHLFRWVHLNWNYILKLLIYTVIIHVKNQNVIKNKGIDIFLSDPNQVPSARLFDHSMKIG